MLDYSIASGTIARHAPQGSMSLPRDASPVEKRSRSGLAQAITRKASKQTYYTIRLLADRPLAEGAYQSYAYFRWLDDVIDEGCPEKAQRLAFLQRQQDLVRRCYQGERPADLMPQEQLVADLIHSDPDWQSGQHTYIREMMTVMAFDAERKGRLITGKELDSYTHSLATAVTEALHYFIGNGSAAPAGQARYQAVMAAHITHMLRDAVEDTQNGYYNIPHDYLAAHGITPWDFGSYAYWEWVRSRSALARNLFAAGKATLSQVRNLRCRLAGYAYIARFEIVLDAIERDCYQLRTSYPERKSKKSALKMGAAACIGLIKSPLTGSQAVEPVCLPLEGIA